jgi:fission process protein 1
MGSKAPKKNDFDPQIPHERKEDRPDFSTPPPARKLPKGLQDTLDDDEKLLDALYAGT